MSSFYLWPQWVRAWACLMAMGIPWWVICYLTKDAFNYPTQAIIGFLYGFACFRLSKPFWETPDD